MYHAQNIKIWRRNVERHDIVSASNVCSLDQPASINSRFSSVDHTRSLTAAGVRVQPRKMVTDLAIGQ